MNFDDTAIEQAAAMTTALISGEALLFRLDLEDVARLEELLVMLMLGAAPHRLAEDLAVPFFLLDPAAIGAEVDDDSLALVGPGITQSDQITDDIRHAPPGTKLAGVLVAGDQERLQSVAVTADHVVAFVASTPTTLHRLVPDEDDPLVDTMRAAVNTPME